jgi:tight adherence protein B
MVNSILFLIMAAPVLTGALLLIARRRDRLVQFAQQRLRALTVGEDDSEPIPHLTRARRAASASVFQLPGGVRRWLDAAFGATGNRVRLWHLLMAGLISVIVVVAFTSRLLALSPGFITAFSCLAGAAAPATLLSWGQSRYQRHFLDEFPDALDLIGRGVKAGLPVNEALAVAGQEIADPVGGELRRALDQVQIGVHMNTALQEVADRVRVADFRFLVVALALQAKTGGSLAETLANLSSVIRARKALRLKARSLTAEAKASAAVLAALPFVVGGMMYLMNHDLMGTLFGDSRGRFMVGVAFLSLMTGLTVMAVLVRRAVR